MGNVRVLFEKRFVQIRIPVIIPVIIPGSCGNATFDIVLGKLSVGFFQ
jgi:hypothetical protein